MKGWWYNINIGMKVVLVFLGANCNTSKNTTKPMDGKRISPALEEPEGVKTTQDEARQSHIIHRPLSPGQSDLDSIQREKTRLKKAKKKGEN